MEDVQKKPQKSRPKPLENPQQVKEVRAHLEDVNKFVFQLERRGTINSAQAQAYSKQIKQLVLQMTVDNYILNAKQAQGSDKARLTLHYYGLARKLLVRENGDKSYNKQIAQLNAVIASLEETVKETEPEYEETDTQVEEKEKAEKEWGNFEDESWKKKSVYD